MVPRASCGAGLGHENGCQAGKAADSTSLVADCMAVEPEAQGRKGSLMVRAAAIHPVLLLFSHDGKTLFHLLTKQLCCWWETRLLPGHWVLSSQRLEGTQTSLVSLGGGSPGVTPAPTLITHPQRTNWLIFQSLLSPLQRERPNVWVVRKLLLNEAVGGSRIIPQHRIHTCQAVQRPQTLGHACSLSEILPAGTHSCSYILDSFFFF